MLKEDRQRQVLEILRTKGRVEVSQLCQLFNVTNMTIRRDLNGLERSGLLIRSRGGALLADSNILVEHPFNIRLNERREKKLKIAEAALDTILDGRKIFLGSGTTVWYLAQKLDSSRRLIVVTDAVNIASEVITRPSVSVIQIGGDLRPNTYSTVGTFAEDMVRQFKCQHAYIGVTGIGADGFLYVASVAEAGFFRAVFEISHSIFVLADSSKLGVEDFISIGRLSADYTLITDKEADRGLIEAYRSLGAQVILA